MISVVDLSNISRIYGSLELLIINYYNHQNKFLKINRSINLLNNQQLLIYILKSFWKLEWLIFASSISSSNIYKKMLDSFVVY